MSATASVSNPAAVPGFAGPTSAKPAAAAGAHGHGAHTGALGAFDAIMAAFFASVDGTAQLGAAATTTAATAISAGGGGGAEAEAGKPAPGNKDPLATGDDAAQTDKASPDAGLALALLGMGQTPALQTPTVVKGAGAEGTAGGQGSSPTPQGATTPNAGDLLAGQAAGQAATLETPAPVGDAATADPAKMAAAALGGDKAGALSGQAQAMSAAGLVKSDQAALAQAKVATAAATDIAQPPAEAAPSAETAASPAAAVVQQAANPPPAATARPASKADARDDKPEKAPRAARTEAIAPGAAARVGGAAPTANVAAQGAGADSGKDKPAVDGAPSEAAAAPSADLEPVQQDAGATGQASAQATLPTRETQAHAPAPTQVRGSPETVANLSAHLIKKLDERASRFDLQLDPVGLGRVDVRLEINARGQVTAAMSFDNPQAAAELKARSAELQQALEQAGFDISGGMSFDVADQSNGGARQQRDFGSETGSAFRGRAFQSALDTAGEAANAAAASALYYRQAPATGVDVRI